MHLPYTRSCIVLGVLECLDLDQRILEQIGVESDRPELRQVAQNILDTQQAEIDQMQQWRQAWYGQ